METMGGCRAISPLGAKGGPKESKDLSFPCLSPAVLVFKDTLVSGHGLCTCGIPGRQLGLDGRRLTFHLPSPS